MTAHCCRTALDWTVLNSDFNRADKAMTSARLTLPDLPLCPPPNQNTLSAFFLFWLKRHFSPVGVADRLASGPLPASSALPVVQTWRNREDELVTFCIKKMHGQKRVGLWPWAIRLPANTTYRCAASGLARWVSSCTRWIAQPTELNQHPVSGRLKQEYRD